MDLKQLSLNLKKFRERRKLRQQDVAKMLGITGSAYGFYEQGKRIPPSDNLVFLADYYEITLDELIGRSVQDQKNDLKKGILKALDDIEKGKTVFWDDKEMSEEKVLLFKNIGEEIIKGLSNNGNK